MASLNCVQIIGNVGKQPDMRYTPSGSPVASFSVACNRKYEQDGQSREETEWINVVTWNKQAESCNQYLSKGSLVYVEGRLHTRSWDGQDGQKHYRTEVIASQVIFLDKRQGGGQSGEDYAPEDDLPF
jgi:single-strand DNA-binding protein